MPRIDIARIHERVDYPDVYLMVVRDDNGMRYTHKNGESYG
jgi:hypothetical protein